MEKLFKFFPVILSFLLLLQGCTEEKKVKTIDLQGHRGCRGLLPENSIPAMLRALDLGVNTLEMDVIISKDKHVLLSHEPVLSHEICYTELGDEISEDDENLFNLYKMEYADIKKCDCGSKPVKKFPDQQKIKVYKPLLSEVIDTVEQYLKKNSLPLVQYNIEIKSTSETDGTFHPRTAEFTERVMDVLREKNLTERVTIQSFDVRPLQSIRKKYSDVKLALIVENRNGPEKNIEKLGFVPDIYSPDHLLVNEELMQFAVQNGMKVIPWSVNTKEEILSVLKQGVDGIITDYPDKAKEIVKEYQETGK